MLVGVQPGGTGDGQTEETALQEAIKTEIERQILSGTEVACVCLYMHTHVYIRKMHYVDTRTL
jgi:hypothetical protein